MDSMPENNSDQDEIEDFISETFLLPDHILRDHAAWFKYFLSETETLDDERAKWWGEQIKDFKGQDWEWDKALAELRLGVWETRLKQLKRTVRVQNLDSKDIDLIGTKEYRDTLSLFEEQVLDLQDWYQKVMANGMPEADSKASQSAALEAPRFSQEGFSKTEIGKWLSVNESADEKEYRERFDKILARYPDLANQLSAKKYAVNEMRLRSIWKDDRITPFSPPKFPL